jgi:hypothetical protein
MEQYNNKQTPPILCIPRVSNQITEKQIRTTFEDLNIGKLHRVEIRKGVGQNNLVLIHYKSWLNHGNALIVKERLNDNRDVKVIYDDPWYWKVSRFRQ